MKKIVVLVVAVVFLLGAVGFSFADDWEAKITNISGNKVTVKNDKGKSQTITVPGKLEWKVGDKVVVKDGKLFSDDWTQRTSTTGGATTENTGGGGTTTHGPTTDVRR